MRILHVNKFLHRRGGAEAYMLDLGEHQKRAGDEVAFFGMQHPENAETTYGPAFPAFLATDPAPRSRRGQARAAGRMIWSTTAARGIDTVLQQFEPDVVHLHNIYHQLSPSILRPLRHRGIPAVMTLHDYKLACPTYRFLDHGRPCDACIGGDFSQAVRRRCKDGSLGASALLAAETALHRATGAYSPVGAFICPSLFMQTQMTRAGVFPGRLCHLPHFVDSQDIEPRLGRTSVLFAGRLSPEKGVDTLLAAANLLPPSLQIVIAGDGPDRASLEMLASRLAPGRVHFVGHLPTEQLQVHLASAVAVVLPSRWWENQPMTVLEAMAWGAPVVASAIGGVPELIDDNVDGYLVPPDDPAALAAALGRIMAFPARSANMGRAGAEKVRRVFSPGSHLVGLSCIYRRAAEMV